mgnify:CR=1 FL=1
MMKNLDTIFALEFGQLLENHLFASPEREKELEIICSSLNIRNKNQLAQVYAGYDVPTTASIFELIRTLNNAEFTERFFKLKTVNLGGQNISENSEISKTHQEDEPKFLSNYFDNEPNDLRNEELKDSEFEFEDIDFGEID